MRSLAIKFVFSIGIAVLFLWIAVSRMLSDISESLGDTNVQPWDAIREAISAVPVGTLLAYCGLFLVVHLSRIIRWVYQVRPLGERSFSKVFRICSVGFGAIIVLPLRLGEVVRPYMLARESDVSFSQALGTAVVERILDGLVITALLFISVATAPEPAPAVVRNAGYVSLAVFAGATVGLTLFVVQRSLAESLLMGTIGRIAPTIGEKILGLMQGFQEGVVSLRKEGALAPFLTLTVIYWASNALSIWVLATGFGLILPWYAGVGLLAVLVVGIMIPAGPGFFGNFQLFLGEGLKLYLPAVAIGASGLAFALVMNGVQFVIQVGFAVPFFLSSGLSLRKLMEVSASGGEDESVAEA